MVTDHLVGLRPGQTIPATERCLTRAEIASRVFCRTGPQEPPETPSIPSSTWPIGGGLYQVGPSPWLTCNYNYISPLPSQNSLLFEMNQVGSPYLNTDLFAQVNGSPLRLDPGGNLDGMFFGGPQYSPNMGSSVWVGASISIQANFGLDYQEVYAGNYGWNGNGYGFLEVYADGSLINNQTIFKTESHSANANQLTYTFTVQSGVNYYVKAWSAIGYQYYQCYSSVSISDVCTAANSYGNGCDCCTSIGGC
jgi:hypothetical protein